MSGCSGGSCSTCGGGEPDPDRLPPGMLKRYDLNQSTADGTLVWAEVKDGEICRSSLEMVSYASEKGEGRVFAVVFGGPELKSCYPALFGHGANTIYHVRGEGTERYDPEAYSECLAEISERVVPASILIAATDRGREVAPRLAAALETGLTADCTQIEFDGRRMIMTRPAFSGNLMAEIECTKFPQMATVRPGALPLGKPVERTGTAIYWQYSKGPVKDIVSDDVPEAVDIDISEARVLISLGGGIRDAETVEMAYEVAERMGAQVSCSRALADRGLMPRTRQVGLSGRTVAPDLYIAMGVSGSVQHMAGCRNSKRIIAVNTDRDAPIHGYADLSLICDAKQVLRKLLERSGLRELDCHVQDLLDVACDLDVAPGVLHGAVLSDDERGPDGADSLLAVGHLGAPGSDLLH
ncbi:MAG: electron transfer flavoprotein subunit alpha/FixB family protein [Candidatus Methanomethylophilaceae archaeon]|nr:electron transfer flavoprotein subunit alpha/FixB family protein [Candidatus Methanomethylophilaceae archaeon]